MPDNANESRTSDERRWLVWLQSSFVPEILLAGLLLYLLLNA